ncbi:DUF192 domain-containing protein [Pelagibacterium montanilacus]|uniref:DUF192 domain-containing protein n=1 Tax=Pelagibacterium montanilacus TaxID=2185280 RepID=UPI000F8D79C1|nr:DUF192 domain-containing protein [Pelagibacterium montanilacus]
MSEQKKSRIDPRVMVGGAVALALLLGLALWQTFGASSAIASEDRVLIHSGTGTHSFAVEIADTNDTRAQGLMYREELAPDAGMLFDFQEERPVSFWMENTYIPLDMLFIRANGEIARIHENARPLDRTGIPSGEPVRFVLEIPGGRSSELGIAAGDLMEHPRAEQ